MISIRKHLDRLDALEGQERVALEAYVRTLEAIEAAAKDMAGGEGTQCREHMRTILGYLKDSSDGPAIEKSRAESALAIRGLAEAVNRREGDYKQIIRMVAQAGATMAQTGSAHGKQLRQIACEVEVITRLESADTMRTRLLVQVEEMRQVAERAQREGDVQAQRLEQELDNVRTSLKSAAMLAETDPLTGLGNRRRAENAVRQSMGKGGPLCVMSFDLNGFKAINDTYGHAQGDSLLKLVAMHVRRSMRDSDVVCRWGGDEFLVVMPKTGLADAQGAAGRLHSEVFGEFVLGRAGENVRVRITASMGIAELEPGESAERLLERADRLMYGEKIQVRPALAVCRA